MEERNDFAWTAATASPDTFNVPGCGRLREARLTFDAIFPKSVRLVQQIREDFGQQLLFQRRCLVCSPVECIAVEMQQAFTVCPTCWDLPNVKREVDRWWRGVY